MTDPTNSSHDVDPPKAAKPEPIKIKRTIWQWFWTIILMLLGALIGWITAVIIGLITGLIEFTVC